MPGKAIASFFSIWRSWWQRRVSLAISVGITIFAIFIYVFTFVGERPTPIFEFVQRQELNALDTRFRYRPLRYTRPDPRIIIVDIDQHSQEVLGRWPFSRGHFARMLDALREDGARVVAFDITFTEPDEMVGLIRALRERLQARRKQGLSLDPEVARELATIEAQFDTDKEFARAVERFDRVVLGNFFLYSAADLKGLDEATLDRYANLLAFFPFPQVRPLRAATGKQDLLNLIQNYAPYSLLPRGAQANIEILTDALAGRNKTTGFFNVPADPDGVVRRALLALPYGRSKNFAEWDLYASLDVQTVRLFLNLPNEEAALHFDQTGIVDIQFGHSIRVRPDAIGRMMINYQGPVRTYPYISIADVARHKFPPGTFRDKIVLVGATATGIGDLRTTPYGGLDYPGVEIHANVIDCILHQSFLYRGAKQTLADVLLIFFFGIPLGIWMALVTPRWMWFGAFLIAPLVAVDYFTFLHGWWLNFGVPALTLSSNVLLVSLYRALFEEKEKRRVRSAFGQYLSPEVIRRLLVNPRLVEPKKTDITVMFSDIRGFTTISEKLDAQDLALFLNQYLSDMTSLVFDHHGTLDKYIGDAVMAFWGAPFEEPGHATRGCHTALKMMDRVGEMQKKWEAEGKPRLDIGIGLNTGVASVGNMGSVLRYGYTALGDTVNLSSRLEGLNKDYGTHILVNETTFAAARDDGFVFRELDLIRVKGKLQPVAIYELIGRAAENSIYGTPDEVRQRLDLFHQAHEFYRKRRWEDAQKSFQTILDKWPDDGPSRTYWKRCQEYLFDEPPSGWDGVFTMTHK